MTYRILHLQRLDPNRDPGWFTNDDTGKPMEFKTHAAARAHLNDMADELSHGARFAIVNVITVLEVEEVAYHELKKVKP